VHEGFTVSYRLPPFCFMNVMLGYQLCVTVSGVLVDCFQQFIQFLIEKINNQLLDLCRWTISCCTSTSQVMMCRSASFARH